MTFRYSFSCGSSLHRFLRRVAFLWCSFNDFLLWFCHRVFFAVVFSKELFPRLFFGDFLGAFPTCCFGGVHRVFFLGAVFSGALYTGVCSMLSFSHRIFSMGFFLCVFSNGFLVRIFSSMVIFSLFFSMGFFMVFYLWGFFPWIFSLFSFLDFFSTFLLKVFCTKKGK